MSTSRRAIYFAPVPYGSPKQRAHFFVRFLIGLGYAVTWVEPPPARLPRVMDLRQLSAGSTSQPTVEPMVDVARAGLLPVEPLPIVNRMNDWRIRRFLRRFGDDFPPDVIVVGKPSRLAQSFMQRFPDVYAVYDAMDDFPEFMTGLAKQNLRSVESGIAQQADLVVVSCENLQKKFAGCSNCAALVHNACDTDAITSAVPGRGKLGYVGTIGRWFDWETVIRIARECPDFEIELVGPVFAVKPSSLPENVSVAGSLPHQEAMQRLSKYAAGLIPFRINTLTDSVDPVKYYEYRAAGLPVIATPFGTMKMRGEDDFVYHVDGRSGLRELILRAVSTVIPEASVLQFRERNDWNGRWEALKVVLQGQDFDG